MIGAAAGLYRPVLSLIPFEEDNVYVLAWSAATPADRVAPVDPHYYPEWRPLAYASVWLEHHGGAPIVLHFVVNLMLWSACALVAFAIARRLGGGQAAAWLAALLVLTDPRATWALVVIVERQMSLACLCGLAAVLVVTPIESVLPRSKQVAVALLLVASMLSKEFGAAFALGLAAYAVLARRRDLLWPPLIAASAYLVLRVSVIGITAQPYCEEMYWFGAARDVCVDPATLTGVPQMAYNAAATMVNLPLLGLLSSAGQPNLAESRLLTGVAITALAVMAWRTGRQTTRLLVLIAVANAIVSFMLYRERNQLPGACALAILAGLGLEPAFVLITGRAMRTAAAAILVALLAAQAALARALVIERAEIAAQIEPCALEIMDRPFVPPFVTTLKTSYGRLNPECVADQP